MSNEFSGEEFLDKFGELFANALKESLNQISLITHGTENPENILDLAQSNVINNLINGKSVDRDMVIAQITLEIFSHKLLSVFDCSDIFYIIAKNNDVYFDLKNQSPVFIGELNIWIKKYFKRKSILEMIIDEHERLLSIRN